MELLSLLILIVGTHHQALRGDRDIVGRKGRGVKRGRRSNRIRTIH